jgi:tetratricopeptide (TPR) repeat protein
MSARRLGAARQALAALAVLGCAAFVGWTSPARADDAADELARRHFDSGTAYLEESDYDDALKAFQKAYDLSHRPEILLNIATVQERKGDLPAAIAALQAYLEAAPQSERAETTRLRIQNLQKRLDEAPPPAAAPLPPPPPPPSTATTAAPVPTVAPPPPPATASNRTPSYIAFGVAGASVVTAVVTGIVANGEYQDAKDTCSPNCPDSRLSKGKSFALVSTIATGVAVVGAGVGLTLWLTSSSSHTATAAPRLRLAVSTRGPEAALGFGF